ncbi:hypothetical protein Pelo_14115 [Pelomyxa schiedti]|nr:hypothetical protein Pelo_14115 [Pelomyxa schiedti]
MDPLDAATAVRVTNINPTTELKTVVDFFAYCGTVRTVTFQQNPDVDDGTKEAYVFFENPSAAKAALLLTNTILSDSAIVVLPHVVKLPEEVPRTPDTVTFTSHPEVEKPEPTKPPTANKGLFSSVISNTYTFGSGLLRTAKGIDEKHNVSGSVQATGDLLRNKITELDNNYLHLSQVVNQLTASLNSFDNAHGISKATYGGMKTLSTTIGTQTDIARESASKLASTVGDSVNTAPVLGQGVKAMVSVGQTLGRSINNVSKEISAEIDAADPSTRVDKSEHPTTSPTSTTTPTELLPTTMSSVIPTEEPLIPLSTSPHEELLQPTTTPDEILLISPEEGQITEGLLTSAATTTTTTTTSAFLSEGGL